MDLFGGRTRNLQPLGTSSRDPEERKIRERNTGERTNIEVNG